MRGPWLLWAAASATVGAYIGAVIGLPSAERAPWGVSLLIGALCLLAIIIGRRGRRRRPTVADVEPMPLLVAEAVGGPCDGQRFCLPNVSRAPLVIWISDPANPTARRPHTYVLECQWATRVRYRYTDRERPSE